MNKASVASVVILLGSSVAAWAQAGKSADPLQPLAFLAGHCYKGSQGPNGIDEHCFSWVYGGKALRDVHTVRLEGRPDYVGESTYFWDSGARRIEYLYIENAGGIMRGTVEPAEGALVFPAARYVADGEAMTLRVRWTITPDGYEAWSEMQSRDTWATMFKVRMARSS
jgi:hypothetical protein